MTHGLKNVEEALAAVLRTADPLPGEQVGLSEALGRVLAEDLIAPEDFPAFDRAAMDGFAVRAADIAAAGPDRPAELRLSGSAAAGRPYSGRLQPGTAIGITTGAPLPAGADTVVRLEEAVRPRNASGGCASVLVSAAMAAGTNVSFCGEDISAGSAVLKAGTELNPWQIGVLAALGVDPVGVIRRPAVAVIGTGDELAPLGEAPAFGQIRSSNGLILSALVRRAGGTVIFDGLAPDSLPAIAESIERAAADGADAIVTTGGSSAGERDMLGSVLETLGAEIFCRGVAMRPGASTILARLGKTLIAGLSGNPPAAATAFEILVRPALRKMAGTSPWTRPSVAAVMRGDARAGKSSGRRYLSAETWIEDGRFQVRPAGRRKSGALSSLAAANSLLVIPEGTDFLSDGQAVSVILLAEGEVFGR